MTVDCHTLASLVALRLDGPAGICPAWLEAADRRCGKPATVGLLCARHHEVALRRWDKQAAANARWVQRHRAAAVARLPKAEAELAAVEARYAALAPKDYGDTAEQNLPLSRRLPSDARIHELARLVTRRDVLAGEVAGLRSLTTRTVPGGTGPGTPANPTAVESRGTSTP